MKAALETVEGVETAEVSFQKKSARVTYDPERARVEDLVRAVDSTGFRATPVSEGEGENP